MSEVVGDKECGCPDYVECTHVMGFGGARFNGFFNTSAHLIKNPHLPDHSCEDEQGRTIPVFGSDEVDYKVWVCQALIINKCTHGRHVWNMVGRPLVYYEGDSEEDARWQYAKAVDAL